MNTAIPLPPINPQAPVGKRQPPEWELPGMAISLPRLRAWTRGEARALFAARLGLKRLPAGRSPVRVKEPS